MPDSEHLLQARGKGKCPGCGDSDPGLACAECAQRLITDAVTAERARTVAWLRDPGGGYALDYDHSGMPGVLADAIETGEHHESE